MSRQFPALLSLLTITAMSACSPDHVTSARAVDPDLPVSTARAPRPSDSRARYTFYATMPDEAATPTGVRGDNRLANGESANGGASVYEGGICGVLSNIFWYDTGGSQSGDAIMATADGTPCGTARMLNYQGFGLFAMRMNFREIMQLGEGGSRSHQLNMAVAVGGCTRLQYRADVGSAVKVTRLSGNSTGVLGSWRAESEGTHEAACDVTVKGKLQYSGVSYYLPMHVLIEEVR